MIERGGEGGIAGVDRPRFLGNQGYREKGRKKKDAKRTL